MRLTKLAQTCTACPSQWEGELEDGRLIYCRFRGGTLTIRISPEPTTDYADAVRGEAVYSWASGDPWDGFMQTPALLRHLQDAGIEA